MEKRQYSVKELRQVIRETKEKGEFKPVMGKGVEEGDKENSKEFYKSSAKLAKDAEKGIKDTPNNDVNYPEYTRGIETLLPQRVSKEQAENIEAQIEGYFSAADKKAHSADTRGNIDYSAGKKLVKAMKQMADNEKKSKDTAASIGITGEKTGADPDARHTMFKEERIPTLKFKNLKFICESHMLSKIPDSYKVEGKRFNMKDAYNNEYLVEWHTDDDTKVLNKTQINEQQDRIKQLFGYKYTTSNTTSASRLNESDMTSMLNKARQLEQMNKKK